jgi:photosystem II stability/assembly factor-like uncharacterized protein
VRKLILLVLLHCSVAQAADYVGLPALTSATPQQGQILDVEVVGDRVFAVGERGLIIYSDDSGHSWQQARVPVSETLTAVSFASPEHGWAVGHGGVILHSGDSGQTWQLQFDGESANQQWLDYSHGRQQTLEAMLETADEAQKQDLEYEVEEAAFDIEDAELAVETGPADPFLDVWFADTHRGWAVGAYGMIYSTEDGGLRWQLAAAGIENPERYHYYKLSASDDGQIYLSGEAGLLYRSDDGGRNWQRLVLDYDGSLFGVLALDHDTVICFGLRGNIFRSEDSGESWDMVIPAGEPGLSFYGGTRFSDGTVVLVGAGGGMSSSADMALSFGSDVHTSRSTFSAVERIDDDLLLGGMSGLVRISAGSHP